MKYKLILLCFFLLYTTLYGTDWKINIDDGSKSNYDKLIKLDNDTLYVEKSEKIIQIPIENIQKITHMGKYKILSVFCGYAGIYGASISGMIIVGLPTRSELGEAVGAAGGAVAGYIFFRNAILNKKNFDLIQLSNEEKKDIINTIIAKYNE